MAALAHHSRARPARLWSGAWACLVGSGFALLAAPPAWHGPMVAFLGPLFPAGQLAGALALTRGRAPAWLVPAALAASVLRAQVPGPTAALLSDVVTLVLEPAGSLATALLLAGLARREEPRGSLRLLAALLVGVAAVDLLSSLTLADGRFPWWLAAAWALLIASGLPLQLRLAAQRSLEHESRLRRRTEEELQRTRERFRALTESSFDLVAELDGDERFTYVNARYEDALGFPRSWFLGRRPVDFLDAADHAAAQRFAEEASGTGRAAGLVVRVRRRDGGFVWLENTARSFVTEDGERRWVMNSRDVSDRRVREEQAARDREQLTRTVHARTEALQTSEARFRALADHAPELISEFDQRGRYTFANAAFRDLLGHDPATLVGKTPEHLIHPDDLPGSRQGMARALRQHDVARAVHRLRHADGSWRWFDNTGRSYRTRAGELRFVSIGRDVTDARRAEEESRLVQTRIQQAQRLESLGALAGGIAHDFNNLLAVILGNTALLEEGVKDVPEAEDRLRRIRAAALHAEALTDQMLVYAGRSVSELAPVGLSELVRETEDLLRATISKKVRLELHLADDAPPLYGDATQLRQILLNLVINASEALGAAGGRVWVRTDRTRVRPSDLARGFGAGPDAGSECAVLEVSDDGPGMDEDLRRRVFEPFYSTKESGRGLGLAAVLGIANAHGGLIQVDSAPGRGATFRLLLPAAEDLRGETHVAAGAAAPAAAVEGHVLVVDDDEAVREVATQLLLRAGLQAEACCGGREALTRLGNSGGRPVDAVLLDLAMPDLSGAEVLRALRARCPDLPVVIASGYKRDIAGEQVDADEVFAFVQKPYDPDVLVSTLREAVQAGRPGTGPGA